MKKSNELYSSIEPFFDKEYYLHTYPDVNAVSMDPIDHYIEYGVKEFRNPAASFDTRHYLESNPDVASSGMNPFEHYIKYGFEEGRTPISLDAGSLGNQKTSKKKDAVEVNFLDSDPKSIDDFRAIIESDEIDYVSFDIFDTLLVRPVVEPTDLFEIIGRRSGYEKIFKNIRIESEIEARRRKHKDYDDISLNDIYDVMQEKLSLSEGEVESLKQCELDVELQYLRPRKSIVDLYNYALSLNKKVVIASDMYLPTEFLEKVLEKNQIVGYHKLYVSGDVKVAKGSGRLFIHILNELLLPQTLANRVFHIGDNKRADVDQPRQRGLRAGHIEKPIDLFNKSGLSKLINPKLEKHNTSILIGQIAIKVFDNPFTIPDQTLFRGNPEYLGYVIFGPLIALMQIWMRKRCKIAGIKQLIYMMRDGYLPLLVNEKIAKYMDVELDERSIYLSRSMRYPELASDKATFLETIHAYRSSPDMSVSDFVERRLLPLNEKQRNKMVSELVARHYVSEESGIGHIDQYLSYLAENYSEIQKNALLKKKNTDDYIQKNIDLEQSTGLWDIGYRGSVAKHIKRSFGVDTTCFHLFGYNEYHFTHSDDIGVDCFIELDKGHRAKTIIAHLSEDIISSLENSVREVYEEDGELKFLRESLGLSRDSKERIGEIQQGAVNFAEDMSELLKSDINSLKFNKLNFYELYLNYLHHPKLDDAKILRPMAFVDSGLLMSSVEDDVYAQFIDKASNEVRQNEQNRVESVRVFALLDLVSSRLINDKNISYPPIKEIKNKTLLSLEKEFSMFQFKLKEIGKVDNLFIGPFPGFDKGTCNYLNRFLANNPLSRNFVINEAGHLDFRRLSIKLDCPFETTVSILHKDVLLDEDFEHLPAYVEQKLACYQEEVEYSLENIQLRHPEINANYARVFCYFAVITAESIARNLEPEKVVLWNQFSAFHAIINNILKSQDFNCLYWEFGVLPGSFAVDKTGQMGESWPSKCFEEFQCREVSKAEYAKASELIQYLNESNMNRNVQPDVKADHIKSLAKMGREKTKVLLLGQNDYESGLQPYTQHACDHHSPFFASSDELLDYMAELSKDMSFELIYKPHPIMSRGSSMKTVDPLVTVVDQVDIQSLIEFCDVVVTILSQGAYQALIKGKPVVMLGNTQLFNKGCTYQPARMDDIPKAIEDATKKGMTDSMNKNWVEHVARLVNTYLIDDLSVKECDVGLAMNSFEELLRS